jgi:hypothetical protein
MAPLAQEQKRNKSHTIAKANVVLPVREFNTSPRVFPDAALSTPFVHFGDINARLVSRRKLLNGRSLKVIVFGGSVTAGRRCDNTPSKERSCAWPARLGKFFREHANVHYHNIEINSFGSGGARTSSSLPMIAMRISSLKPDVVIWDYAMNDCSAYASGRLRKLALSSKSAIDPIAEKDVEKARRQDANDPLVQKQVSALSHDTAVVIEVFVRLVRQIVPQAMLVFFFAGPPRAWSPEVGWATYDCQQAILPVAAHYKAAVVDYFKLVDTYEKDYKERIGARHAAREGSLWTLPKLVHIPLIYKGKWQDHRHCTWPTHVYLAYIAAAFFQSAGVTGLDEPQDVVQPSSALPDPLSPEHELAKWPVCMKPLSRYMAEDAFSKQSSDLGIRQSGWNLYEDVPGKPGWIATKLGSAIKFDVSFGQRPALAITYLSSYDGLGDVKVELLNAKDIHYTLSGIWNDKTSQATTVFFRAKQKYRVGISVGVSMGEAFTGDGLGGFGIQPNSHHVLQLTLIQAKGKNKAWTKFKVLGVFSC